MFDTGYQQLNIIFQNMIRALDDGLEQTNLDRDSKKRVHEAMFKLFARKVTSKDKDDLSLYGLDPDTIQAENGVLEAAISGKWSIRPLFKLIDTILESLAKALPHLHAIVEFKHLIEQLFDNKPKQVPATGFML